MISGGRRRFPIASLPRGVPTSRTQGPDPFRGPPLIKAGAVQCIVVTRWAPTRWRVTLCTVDCRSSIGNIGA